MAGDLDIVGGAAVDVVPVVPNFHRKLKDVVLPIADVVGVEAGRKLGERIGETMRASLAGDGQRIGNDLGDAIGDALARRLSAAIPDGITAGGRRARTSATREGGQIGGAMAQSIKRRLETAFRSLPRADVRLGDTGFNADLDRLRARIQTLSGKTVGIDIDAGAALAEISAIDAELARLGANHTDVNVRADTATARAALRAIHDEVNAVDRDDVNIRVKADTSGAQRELMQLAMAIGLVAAIPVVPVAAAGIGAIASAAVAAGAGVGALALVAIPAIKGVTSVIQAKAAADKEATTATNNGAAANVKAAQSALQMAGAQQALSSAHRQAAQQIAQSNRAVTDAERSLSDAKRSARQAEDDLTTARKAAADQLRDLNDRLLDGKLDQREATLRVQEAQAELNRVMADPTATDLQKERARLSYDEAVRGVDKQKKANQDLLKSVVEQNKAGVDGNAQVQQAAQRLADANRKVADQTRAVGDAQKAARDAQVNAAESIASAERGVEQARLSSVDTTSKAATKSDDYRKALAKLTPAQRDLYDSIAGPKGLKKAFSDWSTSLQPEVLPIFTRAVDGAKNSLPGLTPLVKGAADGVSELQDAASKELKKPFWRDFKHDIDKSVKPAIVGLGTAFGNVLKGSAGVIDAFLPHIDDIADRLVKSSGRFADWGTNLKGSPEFERFLKYADEHGPKLAKLFGSVVDGVLSIGEALAPISGPVLDFLTGIASGIATVADHAPWLVQGIWAIVVAQKAWNLVMLATNFVMNQNPIVRIIMLIGLLVAAVIWAWNTFPGFRKAVQDCWDGIKDGVQAVVDWFAGPFADFFTVTIPGIFQSVLDWVGKNWPWILGALTGPIGLATVYIIEHWDQISGGISDAWGWLKKHVLYPIRDFFTKTIPGWADALKGAVVGAFEDTTKGIKSTWDKIAVIAAKPINFVIDTVYTHGIKAVWDKIASFVGLPKLPDAPKLLEAPVKFAQGGRTQGGIPGKDSIPILAMADEFIIKRDSARKIGYGKLAHMNATGELPRFADGGIVGGAVDWVKAGADLLVHPSKIWNALMKPVLDKVSKGVGSSPMGRTVAAYPAKMIGSLRDKIVNAASSMFAAGGGIAGQWRKPVDVPFGTRFGASGSMWASGRHTGLDFPAPIGTPVRAVQSGIVSDVSSSGPYGNHLQINHGGGLSSLYAHLSQILTGLNKHVSQGDVIGKVGATGNVTGPHLHLEARVNGKAVDPMPFLTGGGNQGSKSVGAAQTYARGILGRYGWGPSEFTPLQKLWNGESGWRYDAKNPSSGAYGIPQALPGSKMASAGSDWLTNYATQIRWGLGYIKDRPDYGSPSVAYAKWLSRSPHWYDEGGFLPPGLNLVANGTGRPEPVFTGSQWADIRATKGGSPAVTVNVEARTYLDGREVGGFVDQRIDVRESANADALNNGRWV
ncbi:peptidoglycan DD-metalloendopeptidase family protein [Streptomyces mirabilis]|uniref:aggregation-promoting factor C-terminal-like domain-containing protein n=1 Tax=Streptomyces mirabilis TaxID=68239 RepID=UPI0033CBD815